MFEMAGVDEADRQGSHDPGGAQAAHPHEIRDSRGRHVICRVALTRFANPSSDELHLQERELTEQIFRLRFQLSTGQAEALKRLRDARKDLARVKTHLRAQELNQAGAHIATQKPEQPEARR